MANRLLNEGDPYVKSLIQQDKDRIISILQNNGYFRAFVADTLSTIVENTIKPYRIKTPATGIKSMLQSGLKALIQNILLAKQK